VEERGVPGGRGSVARRADAGGVGKRAVRAEGAHEARPYLATGRCRRGRGGGRVGTGRRRRRRRRNRGGRG
jgi:hypothetical protein